MRVRLTRKLAQEIDGVDLTNYEVGDVLDLPDAKAKSLLAEEWAEPERRVSRSPNVIAFRRQADPGHLDRDDKSRAS